MELIVNFRKTNDGLFQGIIKVIDPGDYPTVKIFDGRVVDINNGVSDTLILSEKSAEDCERFINIAIDELRNQLIKWRENNIPRGRWIVL